MVEANMAISLPLPWGDWIWRPGHFYFLDPRLLSVFDGCLDMGGPWMATFVHLSYCAGEANYWWKSP